MAPLPNAPHIVAPTGACCRVARPKVSAVLALSLAWAVVATAGIAHEPYNHWTDENGKSCCSGYDCAATRVEFRDDGAWWAVSPDGWVRVPARKVIRQRSPDNDGHLCYNVDRKEVLCFVPPPTTM